MDGRVLSWWDPSEDPSEDPAICNHGIFRTVGGVRHCGRLFMSHQYQSLRKPSSLLFTIRQTEEYATMS